MSEIHSIPDEARPVSRKGFRVTTLMVVVLVVGGSVGMFTRLVLQARAGAKAKLCQNNLKLIGMALHNYHSFHGCFPPASVADATGKPIHSWRMLIVPYIEAGEIYNTYNLSQPWDSPSNMQVYAQYSDVPYLRCPSREAKLGLTSYVMIVGPKTVAPGVNYITLSDIRDGAAETIMVAEVSNVDIPWTEPRDLDASTMSWLINDPAKPSISSPHPRGPSVLFADGSVRQLDPSLAPATLKAMTTIAGGEPIPPH